MAEQVATDFSRSYTRAQIMQLGARAIFGNYISHGLLDADGRSRTIGCVVVPSFGHEKKGGRVLPGLSNIVLAAMTEMYPGIPVIAQFEVDDGLRAMGQKAACRIGEPGVFCNTRKFMAAAVAFMQRENLLAGDAVPLLLAKDHHAPRSDAALQVLLPADVEVGVPEGLHAIPWPGIRSSQVWTWSPASWGPRELCAIGHFDEQGWLDLTHAAPVRAAESV
jgi:hypothetical protein